MTDCSVQGGFTLTQTAFRKHLNLQSRISSMRVLSTYFGSAYGQGVNFVQNVADVLCIE